MSRPSVAFIDLDALVHNYRVLAAHVQRDAGAGARRVIAVVKANAYGHGALPAALALERAGADILACADVDEGVALREGGVRCRILVFGSLSLSDLDGIFTHGLIPSVSTPTAANALQAAARARGARVRYHLKIDTGMNRVGFRHDNLARTAPDVLAAPNLELEAVYTHYATADVPGDPRFESQQRRFAEALQALAGMGARPEWTHAANSAAIFAGPETWFGGVRPGLALYGAMPSGGPGQPALRPVLHLRTRVAALKGIRPGDGVGYGARFVADSPRTVAILPLGYADGIDRRMEGRGHVLVRDRRAPIVGSVCMDMIAADVTGLPAEVGDEVVVVGRQGGEAITIIEVADQVGTIPYELLCRVGPRIERIYNQAG